MNTLGSLGYNQLQGIVKSDETFFRESMKGEKLPIAQPRSVEKKTKREVFLALKLLLS